MVSPEISKHATFVNDTDEKSRPLNALLGIKTLWLLITLIDTDNSKKVKPAVSTQNLEQVLTVSHNVTSPNKIILCQRSFRNSILFSEFSLFLVFCFLVISAFFRNRRTESQAHKSRPSSVKTETPSWDP